MRSIGTVRFVAFAALALVIGGATTARAAEYADKVSGLTITAGDAWKQTQQAKDDATERMQLESGKPAAPDTYYVFKVGHVVEKTVDSAKAFKDEMVKMFPKEWKMGEITDVTVGKDKVAALKIPYTFSMEGFDWKMELYLFKRGDQFTYFQVMSLAKGWDAADKAFQDLITTAAIEPKGGTATK